MRSILTMLSGTLTLLTAASVCAQGLGGRPPAPSKIASIAAPQKWEYEQFRQCQTPDINSRDMSDLLRTRYKSLGSQNYELVSVISVPVLKDETAEYCIYAVFKRPQP